MKMNRSFALGLALLLTAITRADNLPDKVRILSCDLSSAVVQPASPLAVELKRLLEKADPDIVVLQHVMDWENCDRIAKLRPGLQVITCSGFAGPSGQTAILARDKAILSWVDEAGSGQGFAFGLLQTGARKLGVFSVQSTSDSGAAGARVLEELKKLKQFADNRADSFLIAGSFLSKTEMTQAGFGSIGADLKPNAKTQPADFWVFNSGFLSRPRAITIAGIAQPVLVTDIDTAGSYSSKFATQTPLLFAGETPAPVRAVVQPQTFWQRVWPIGLAILGVVGGLLAGAFLLLRSNKNDLAVVPVNSPNGGVGPGQPLDESTRAGLLAWVKTAFMQRLIAERRQMIAVESEATQRTIAIEEKISHLQTALQERISAYESRIARLETELTAAAFENRDLIRGQIEMLKEKVAQAKEEFEFRRN